MGAAVPGLYMGAGDGTQALKRSTDWSDFAGPKMVFSMNCFTGFELWYVCLENMIDIHYRNV